MYHVHDVWTWRGSFNIVGDFYQYFFYYRNGTGKFRHLIHRTRRRRHRRDRPGNEYGVAHAGIPANRSVMNRSPSDMRSITEMRLPALPPGAEPDVVMQTRPTPSAPPADTRNSGLTNLALNLDENITAPTAEADNEVNMANEDNGEPIHMTLEEVKRSMVKDEPKTTFPMTSTDDKTETNEYVNVNAENSKKVEVGALNRMTDPSASEYYNVNHFNKQNRPEKSNSKDTNVDLEYAEVSVEDNTTHRQGNEGMNTETNNIAGVQYAAIDKDKTKRKRNIQPENVVS